MESLLYFRQKTKGFFQSNEMILIPLIKFVLMMAVLLLMNWHLGYRYMLMRWILVILVSLICSILPWQGITVLSAFYLVGHVTALSWEGAAVLVLVLLTMAMLHYLFLPGGSILVVLIPLAFYLKVPYLVPLLAGVFGSTLSFIPVGAGVVVYYLMNSLEKNAGALLDPGNDILSNLKMLMGSMNDTKLYVALLAFCLVTMLVYAVSRIHLDYSRFFGIGIGGVVLILIYLLGGYGLGVEDSYGMLILSCILCTLIAGALAAWFDVLDYSCTEYLEYEDDDYMYYVKAVPKIKLTERVRKVHDIGSLSDRDFDDVVEEKNEE